MPTYRVDELEGALLDAAVAKVEGVKVEVHEGFCYLEERFVGIGYCPSSRGNDGLPIIERERISLMPPEAPVHRNGGPASGWGESGMWTASSWKLRKADGKRSIAHHDTSPLIAAMRLFVKCRLGEEIEL